MRTVDAKAPSNRIEIPLYICRPRGGVVTHLPGRIDFHPDDAREHAPRPRRAPIKPSTHSARRQILSAGPTLTPGPVMRFGALNLGRVVRPHNGPGARRAPSRHRRPAKGVHRYFTGRPTWLVKSGSPPPPQPSCRPVAGTRRSSPRGRPQACLLPCSATSRWWNWRTSSRRA